MSAKKKTTTTTYPKTTSYKGTWNTKESSTINTKNINEPKVDSPLEIHFSLLALQQMWGWTDAADEEWSGLGYIREDFEGKVPKIYVESIHLVKQVNDMASTKMDSKDVNRLITDLLNEDKDPKWLRLWIHSHGSGTVFWSGTDEKTCATFGRKGYMISVVVNQNRDIIARLNMYEPIRVTVDTLPVFYSFTDAAINRKLKEEYDKMAHENPWMYHGTQWTRSDDLTEKELAEAIPQSDKDKRLEGKSFDDMTVQEWEEYCRTEYLQSPTSLEVSREFVDDEDSFDTQLSGYVMADIDEELNDDGNPICYERQWDGALKCSNCDCEYECVKSMQELGRLDTNFDLTDEGHLHWGETDLKW